MPFKPDPANDPNEAYAVIPAPAELRGPLKDWWMVTRQGELVWFFPPDRRDLAIRFATDPAYRQQRAREQEIER